MTSTVTHSYFASTPKPPNVFFSKKTVGKKVQFLGFAGYSWSVDGEFAPFVSDCKTADVDDFYERFTPGNGFQIRRLNALTVEWR